jgi:signal transduction histidine kinase
MRLSSSAPRAREQLATDHQSLVRTGAAVAWLATAYLLIGGWALDDPAMIARSIAPLVAAAGATAMAVKGWELGIGAAVFGAALIAVQHKYMGSANTATPALLALVAIAAAVVTMVERRKRVRTIVVWAIALAVVPAWWQQFAAGGWFNAVTALLTFSLIAPLAITARNLVAEGHRRYRNLFESLPMTVLEQDWTEVREALAELRRSGVVDLESYLVSNPEAVGDLITKVKTVDANPAAIEKLGIEHRANILGAMRPERVSSANWRHFADQLVALWNATGTFQNVFRVRTYDGRSIWMQMRWADTGANSRDGHGSVIVAAADVTEAKLAEEKNARLARLRGDLIDAVGHELRTPLSVVAGLSDQIATDLSSFDEETLQELLGLINREAQAVSTIVENLIAASLMETGDFKVSRTEFDLIAMMHRLFADLAPQFRTFGPAELRVRADRDRTRQLLSNLVTTFGHYGGQQLEIQSGLDRIKAWVTFHSRDAHFEPDEVKRIFDNDGHIDRGGLTTGFGLALGISRNLAKRMGGSLSYTHNAAGSTFRLELPIALTAYEPVAVESKSNSQLVGHTR